MSNAQIAALIAVMAAVTFMLRVLPFLLFGSRRTPAYIQYLGKYLPYAVIGMLCVYCVKDVSFASRPFGAPELIAIVITAGLHAFRRNTLLSIIGGTGAYMALIHLM